MRIIKTFALDVPKGKEVLSTIDNGQAILFTDNSFVRLPKGQWRILNVENGTVHLLPGSKDVALKEGFICE